MILIPTVQPRGDDNGLVKVDGEGGGGGILSQNSGPHVSNMRVFGQLELVDWWGLMDWVCRREL
ncbi:hypothetical protein CsSME_00003484 [Camellia sinensis var. sinensis]